MERPIVEQAFPLQPMGCHGKAVFHTAVPRRAHSGVGGLKEAAAHGEPTQDRLQAGTEACGEEPLVKQEVCQELLPLQDLC